MTSPRIAAYLMARCRPGESYSAALLIALALRVAAGAAGFAGASVLAAYATSPGMLIAARAVLGVAGATLAPSTPSLIRNMFPDPSQRGIAFGVIYGLKQLAQGGGPGWVPALAIAGGAVAGAAFAFRQHTLADPLLDLRLFRLPGFTAALGSNARARAFNRD